MDKITNSLSIEIAPGTFVDEGDGTVSFPGGLVITDDTTQRNGTRYDIGSLDITRYGNQLTGDHKDELGNLIGETIGVVKDNGKVIVSKIRYAINENPYARLAYSLLIGGFSKNFSTETIGPKPDDITGIYWNAELVGLSQVVTQNNYNAHINKVVHNSLEQSKQDGLDVTGIEEMVLNHVEEEKKMEEIKTETETLETETPLVVEEVKTDESTQIATPVAIIAEEEEEKAVIITPVVVEEPVIEQTEETKTETAVVAEPVVETQVEAVAIVAPEEKETNNKEQTMENETPTSVTAEQVAEIVANALKPFATQVAEMQETAKNAFDASAAEPEFKKEVAAKNDYKGMAFEDRYQAQVDAAWNAVKLNNIDSWNTLREINQINLDALKEAGIARNAMSLEDLGNFVIAPEMYNEIAGHRNDYTSILTATEWKETLSLEFAWLQRVGDIDMKSVALNATALDADANLKPVSEYSAVPKKSQLEELAAVTVVATSATRFAAVDLLSDAAAGYRNDFDRKRAQLVIAKLEGAIDESGFSVAYNPTSDVDALTAWIDAVTMISDTTLNGTLVFNARTFAELKSRALKAGANGPLSEILTTGALPTVFGYSFVIVPNDLMPSLGGSEVVAHLVEGVAVPINHAIYFADLKTFTGRTSGGLQYDVSNSAPYEVNGVVKSAYQRNELVLRGSFFRGGAVKDIQVVAGVRQGAAANVS